MKNLLSTVGALIVLTSPVWASVAAGALLPVWLLGLAGMAMGVGAVALSRADTTLPLAVALVAMILGGASGLMGANAMPVLAVLAGLIALVALLGAAFLSVVVALTADDPDEYPELDPTL